MGQMIIDLSSVGWNTPSDVSVKLNGQSLHLDGVFHKDRSFFTIYKEGVQELQNYSLEIQEEVKDGDNVLGFALAYALPAHYDLTENKIGAFASYDAWGSKSYRPTHNSCLMKDMRRLNFCMVDQENMWIKFLNRVSLIDSLEFEDLADNSRKVSLKTQRLDDLKIRWEFCSSANNCRVLEDLEGQKDWILKSDAPKGNYRVKVQFQSSEVRLPSEVLSDSQSFVFR
jgi:hypothetical protein